MRKKIAAWLFVVIFVFAQGGCGGSSGGSQTGAPPANTITMSTKEVHLPEGISAVGAPSGDFSGGVFAGGSSNEVAGFVAEKPDLTAAGGSPSAALAGAAAAPGANSFLVSAESTIGAQIYIAAFSNISKSTVQNPDTVIAQYAVTLAVPKTPIELSNEILQLIGMNKNGGAVSNLPAVTGATPSTSYRMGLTVQYHSASAIVVIVSLVPESSYNTYAAVLTALGDGTNVLPTGSAVADQTDSFTAAGGGGSADFLFVIDNSGSMSNEQTAVSQAAANFITEIQNSGLDFRIGVITTDSDVLSTMTSTDNACAACTLPEPFTNDVTEFSRRVVQGTSGSATETAIYWSEKALLTSNDTTSYGLSGNGSVTSAGFPRAGSSMSVVYLSDEKDQYTSKSVGVAFDVNNNIFVSKGYPVYAIVDPADAATSQYDELAATTGGLTSDINDTSTFPAIMQQIVFKAGGATSAYVLSGRPLSSSIKVTVNGTAVAAGTSAGWQYIASSNSIVFYGSAIPQAGASVNISYQYVSGS